MNRRERDKLLTEAGFSIERQGARHTIWSNGTEKISISFSWKTSPRTLLSFKSRMRKYLKAKEQKALLVNV